MRATALWLAASSMVATGVLVARTIGTPMPLAVLGCVVWVAAAIAIVGSLVCVDRWAATAIALLLLAGARGLTARPPWPSDALDTPSRGHPVGIRWFVVEDASWPGPSCQLLARPQGTEVTTWLDLPGALCPLAAGDLVAVALDGLVTARGPRWPGAGDPREIARSRGAALALSAEHAWHIETAHNFYWSEIAALRERLWRRARGDDARGFVISSLYGVRTALASERRRELATSGLGHLVAVSGMQVSLVAWAIHRALMRITAWWTPSLGLGLSCASVGVVAYVGLVGAEAPSVRAALMTAAVGLGALLGRPAHAIALLVATSCAMLLVRPAWVEDIGFQLSFAAMASVLTMPTQAGIALQSWRVGWSVMPIVIWHFGETSAWAVVANVIAVPIFALWVTPWGVGAIVLAEIDFVDAWLSTSVWAPASWGAALILDVARFIASLPQASPMVLAWSSLVCLAIGLLPRVAQAQMWRRWAPGRITCGAVIAAAVWRPGPAATPTASWFAFGSQRDPTVLARVADRTACAWGTSIAPERWPGLLDALAIDEVVLPDLGETPPPHVTALRDALVDGDRLADPAACERPDAQTVAEAIATCSRLAPSPFVAADDHHFRCHVGGAWHGPFDLHSGASIPR